MSSVVRRANSEEVRHAATLIVVAPTTSEDSEYNYKILMVKLSSERNFGNAHVFPGGEVAKSDEKWKIDDASEELHTKVCAIRETFEKSGLLLTHPPAHTVLNDDEKDYWRQRVHDNASEFNVMCDTFNLKPAVDNLISFATIITPFSFPRRHKTQYYLTVLEPYVPVINTKADDKSTVQLDWFTPEQALARWDERTVFVHTPQWYCLNLMLPISNYKSITQAGIGALRTRDGHTSIAIMPQFGNVGSETEEKFSYRSYWSYPGDEKYLDIENGEPTGYPGDRHRIYIRGWNGDYTLEKNVDLTQNKKSRL